MKPFRITVNSQGRQIQIDGIFSSSFSALIEGMGHLDESDPHGRVEVKPI